MPYRTWYKPGDWNVLDDFSGFRLKHSQARKVPGGQTGQALVARSRWEAQHPQDFVRGVIDDQNAPAGELRPRQQNNYMVVATFVTAYSPRLTNCVQVDDTTGFEADDLVQVMLDTGENYYPVIYRVGDHELCFIPHLPQSVGGPYNSFGMVGNYGEPLQNTILLLTKGLGTAHQLVLGGETHPPLRTPFVEDDGETFIAATP